MKEETRKKLEAIREGHEAKQAAEAEAALRKPEEDRLWKERFVKLHDEVVRPAIASVHAELEKAHFKMKPVNIPRSPDEHGFHGVLEGRVPGGRPYPDEEMHFGAKRNSNDPAVMEFYMQWGPRGVAHRDIYSASDALEDKMLEMWIDKVPR